MSDDEIEDRLRTTLRAKGAQVEPGDRPPQPTPAPVVRRRAVVTLAAAAVVLLAVLAGVLLVNRSDDDPDPAPAGPAPSTTAVPDTTTTAVPSTTTTLPSGGGLPGTPIDIFPYQGAQLAVVGVAADDVLNVRAGPGVGFEVVARLDPLHQGAVATGRNRQLPSGAVWAEIEADGTTGWANTAFLLQPGATTDETARLYPTPADRPTAASMAALARTVAADVASTEPRSEVTIVDGPTVGDLGEVVVDVIGLGDDAVGGYRLHLFADPGPGGDGPFSLRTVESTVLCSRGVDAGACL